MAVVVHQEGSKTVLDVKTNYMDFRNAGMLKEMVSELVDGGNRNVILDLSQVSFMDSLGLSVLLSGKRVTEESGGSFSICGLQERIKSLFNLTNLHKTIKIYPSNLEALSTPSQII